MIYADNAATTKLDKAAFEAMIPYLTDEYGNPSSAYSFSRTVKKALKEAREIIAECINAEPEEIYFTSGGTESDNWAIKVAGFTGGKEKSIITSEVEHHAILNSCKFMDSLGYNVKYMPTTKDGVILPNTLERFIDNNVSLVSVMMINNELGTIEPIKELCEIAHCHDALFHTDAVQAVGHTDIDVKKLCVDMLSASAHKFNGPRGVGFLYVNKNKKIPSLLNGGAQENGMRGGTENVAGIVGMAVALKHNIENLRYNYQHIKKLEALLLKKLNDFNIRHIKNGGKNTLPGIISLSFDGKSGEALLHRLDLMKICISTGSACDSHNTKISHVLQAIKLPKQFANGTIRISLGKYNTEEDILTVAKAITKCF